MKDISILVADDHPLLLTGISTELKTRGFHNIHAVSDGFLALEFIKSTPPDIAILDIEMPKFSGFQVIKKALDIDVSTRFIIFTSHKEVGFVLKAKQLKISGYILKDEPFSEVEACIKKVSEGGTFFSEAFHDFFDAKVSPKLQMLKFLSKSETTILQQMAFGYSSKEISDKLFISVRTVEKHRSHIKVKFDLPKGKNVLTKWVQENKELILSK